MCLGVGIVTVGAGRRVGAVAVVRVGIAVAEGGNNFLGDDDFITDRAVIILTMLFCHILSHTHLLPVRW